YLLRTIPRSAARVWKLEDERLLNKEGVVGTVARTLRNGMLGYALGQIALLLGLYLIGGAIGLLFYIGHIVVAHVVLESVNYIQHYGVLRKAQGERFEKTQAQH